MTDTVDLLLQVTIISASALAACALVVLGTGYLSWRKARTFKARSRAGDYNLLRVISVAGLGQLRSWLDTDLAVPVRASSHEQLASTVHLIVPSLSNLGFAPSVEIEATIDPESSSARIEILTSQVEPEAVRLEISVRGADGSIVALPRSPFGVTVFPRIALSEHSPEDLTFAFSYKEYPRP